MAEPGVDGKCVHCGANLNGNWFCTGCHWCNCPPCVALELGLKEDEEDGKN